MLFNSFHFALFFPVVLTVVFFLRRRVVARNLFLLISSYYFYACWDWRFLSLIVISTVVDYCCGIVLNVRQEHLNKKPEQSRKRQIALIVSLLTNLGILCFFKYFDFFVASARDFLSLMGFKAHLTTLKLILPVGISFYTFQTLSYTIDLYRGKVETERNLLTFALYVAFFPQLVAGPIERAKNLLPQMRSERPMTLEQIYAGISLMGWGMFKKVVLADSVAKVADSVFSLNKPSGILVILGVYAFAIQIYCDFSGYTDIARGAARCMGFHLMQNFRLPYFSTNPQEFWTRWHISLSSWLRDYLYIPLGGNRKGTIRTYINLMTTMVLGGLWHGAAWTFIVWGFYHGTLLCLHRMVKPLMERYLVFRSRISENLWFLCRLFVFFHLTCVGWLLFRSTSMAQGLEMFVSPFTNFAGPIQGEVRIANLLGLVGCFTILLVVQLAQYWSTSLDFISKMSIPRRALIYAAGILVFLIFGEFDGGAFIYFQF